MSINTYIPANNNVICDVCGKKKKMSECVLAYGSGTIPVIVSCKDGCADVNHPLNYPPPVIFDGRPVPNARPEAPNSYIPLGKSLGHLWNTTAVTWNTADFTWSGNSDQDGIYKHPGTALYYWGHFLSDPSSYWGHISNDSLFSTAVNHYWGNF